MYKYIFWDYDNTIVDNGHLHWEKHVNVLARHGITLNPSYMDIIYHNNGEQNWQILTRDFDLKIPCKDYLEQIDAWYLDRIATIPLRDGIGEALGKLHQLNAHQCIVTNARRASVVPVLQNKNLIHYFDFILSKEDYVERKPNPVPYLTAIDRMEKLYNISIDKGECMAIEDDPLGVQSAYNAGINVIHRRRYDDDKPSPIANTSIYHGDDLLKCLLF